MFHHGEIHIAIGAVGRPFCFQLGDQGANGVKALGGPGHTIGRQNVEPVHVGHKGLDIALTHDLHRAALLGGAVQDLVVDVGVVLHKSDGVAAPEQIPA